MAIKHIVKAGETLNSIAQSYGYSNYKNAGITAVPSGNFNLINPGESIDIPNYDPSKVTTIGETTPVISSKDAAGEYAANGAKLDSKYPPPNPNAEPQNPKTITDTGTGSVATDTTKVETKAAAGEKGTGDPLLDKMDKYAADQAAKFEKDAADKKAQRESLYQTSLAAVDQTYANTVANINATYDKSIQEQKRINSLTIDRVKAYGLGGKSALINPIEYTDAVSSRETEADNKIRDLDNQRNNLLAQAKAAKDQGENGLLKEKLDALDKVENDMRTEIQAAAEEATRQYNVLRQVRQDQEKQHQDAVAKMLNAAKAKFAQQFADAKTQEDRDKIIKKILTENGVTESSDLYYQLLTTLGGAATELKKAKTDAEKDAADIAYKKAQTSTEYAQGDKARAEAAKAWRTANGIDTTEEDTMKKDIPATFVNKADAEAAKVKFVTRYGKKGREYWDAIFTDDAGVYKYTYDAKNTGGYKSLYEADTQSTDSLAPLRSQLKKGEILIRRNGQVGAVPVAEYNSKTDTKL